MKKVHVNQKVVRLTQAIEILKERLKEIESMTHKKESEFCDDSNLQIIEKRIEKKVIVSNMYIGKYFF